MALYIDDHGNFMASLHNDIEGMLLVSMKLHILPVKEKRF